RPRTLRSCRIWTRRSTGPRTIAAMARGWPRSASCFGGRTTWLYAAHNPNLKASVAFYGLIKNPTSDIKPKTALDIADQLHCPLLGLYGGQDQIIPVDLVHQAEDKAKAAGKTVEIVVYPD